MLAVETKRSAQILEVASVGLGSGMGSAAGRKQDAGVDLQVPAWSSWVVLVTARGKGGMGRQPSLDTPSVSCP